MQWDTVDRSAVFCIRSFFLRIFLTLLLQQVHLHLSWRNYSILLNVSFFACIWVCVSGCAGACITSVCTRALALATMHGKWYGVEIALCMHCMHTIHYLINSAGASNFVHISLWFCFPSRMQEADSTCASYCTTKFWPFGLFVHFSTQKKTNRRQQRQRRYQTSWRFMGKPMWIIQKEFKSVWKMRRVYDKKKNWW